MHRVLFVALIAAALLIAPAASAEMYLGLRLVGDGTFNGDLEPIPDAGFYTAREFVVGFGEEIQGEFGIGFDNMSTECPCEDEEYPDRDFTYYDSVSYKLLTFAAAGFYPIQGGAGGNRVDVGLRFRYLSASWEDETDYYGRDEDDLEKNEYGVSGWSIGPVMRAQWRCCNDRIGIGPEIGIKYGSYTKTQTYTYPGSEPYDSPDRSISGWTLDYSLRFDFFFDPK